MKIKGEELLRWVDEAWPGDDWYWEHDLFEAEPEPDKVYDTSEIEGLLYQGPRHIEPPDMPSIDTLIRRWRKERDQSMLFVDCPKAVEAEVREYLRSKGCKVS